MTIIRAGLLLLLFTGTHCAAQNIRRISYVIDSLLSHHTISANILIATDSRPIFKKSVGFADINTARPLQNSSLFLAASLSKQFTAYGIMLLQHKGLLAYDSSVTKYITNFPYPGITIRHLLTHTSGLPNFTKAILPGLDTSKSNGNNELLAFLAAHKPPLQWLPGLVFEYSDIGYALLATVIERVSGKSYHSFMKQYIFRRANMRFTSAEQVTDIRKIKKEQLATGHIFDSTQQTFVPAHLHSSRNYTFYPGDFYGDGPVVTSTFDMFLWHRALTRNFLLPEAQQQEAFTPCTVNGALPKNKAGRQVKYGFGWAVGSDEVMGSVLSHGGVRAGFASYYYRFPDKKLCFVFLSNAETPANNYLRSRILDLLKEKE
jgi:CubicO group peptidase (beta-lactamase class C family)